MKDIVIPTSGDPITIKFDKVKDYKDGTRGYFDANKGLIIVEESLTKADKYATLVHELMHLIDEIMVQNKIYTKHTPHSHILHIADNLLVLMTMAGMIKGLTKQEAMEFMNSDNFGDTK